MYSCEHTIVCPRPVVKYLNGTVHDFQQCVGPTIVAYQIQ